jgi:hypothetical protein
MSVTLAEKGRGVRVALGKPTTLLFVRSDSSILMLELSGTCECVSKTILTSNQAKPTATSNP